MKRPNLHLISVLEDDGENKSKEENTLQDIPGELPQPSKAGQHTSPGNAENTTKTFVTKRNTKAHNRQIHQG